MRASQKLALVRTFHTAVYVVMASSVLVVLYAGVAGVSGAWVWVALVLVAFESAVFVGNGFACPLTALAVKYRDSASPLSDTYFPEHITRHTFRVFGPLILTGVALLAARWAGILS